MYIHDEFLAKKERDTDNKGSVDVRDLGDNWALVIEHIDDPYGVDVCGLPGTMTDNVSYSTRYYIDRKEGILYDSKAMATYTSQRNRGTRLIKLYEAGYVHPDPDLLKQAESDGFTDQAENWYEWDYSLMCEKMQIVGEFVLRDDLGTGHSYERGEYRYFVPDSDLTPDQMIEDWNKRESYGHNWQYIFVVAKLYFEGVKVGEDAMGGVECWFWGADRRNTEAYMQDSEQQVIRQAIATMREYIATKLDKTVKDVTPFNSAQFERQIEKIASLQVAQQTSDIEILRRANIPQFDLSSVDLWELHAV